MRFLPSNLASLAIVAGDRDTKYAITAVHLIEKPGGYRVEATDTRILSIVTGKDNPEGPDLKCFDAIKQQPNGGASALIPAEKWKSLLTPTKEQRKAARRGLTSLDFSAISIAEPVALTKREIDEGKEKPPQIVSVVSSDNIFTHQRIQAAECVDGRYPPVDEIQPKGKPIARIRLGISYLMRLLEAAQRIAGENDAVTLEIFKERQQFSYTAPQPVRFTAQPDNRSQLFVGLAMPMDAVEYVDPLAKKEGQS